MAAKTVYEQAIAHFNYASAAAELWQNRANKAAEKGDNALAHAYQNRADRFLVQAGKDAELAELEVVFALPSVTA